MIFFLFLGTVFCAKIKKGYHSKGELTPLKEFYPLKAEKNNCRRVCRVIGQNCPWAEGLCFIKLPSTDKNRYVGNMQSCDLLCHMTENCTTWNFTRKSIHRKSGECQLLKNTSSLEK